MGKDLSSKIQRVYDSKGMPVLLAGGIILFLLEKKYALRKRKVPLLKRLKTNAAIATFAGLVTRLALIPLVVKAAALGEKKGLGIVRLPLPPIAKYVIGFLILDYGSYRWHKLNHKIPFLWRFHQVHHADLDLDLSTASRFHVGEVSISILYRGLWAFFFGVSAKVSLVYEIVFELATGFHHSNLKLTEKADSALAKYIVTPRMHGIHHSVIKDEMDSNYSVVMTIWDRLHKSFQINIPQDEVNIGVPYVRAHKGAKALLLMPFKEDP